MIPLKEIERAAEVMKPILHPTPLQYSRTFSRMAGGEVFLKAECLQWCGSHKIRGAYYMLHKYPPPKRAGGVVSFSSGNWAQGIAHAGALLEVPITVIMPEDANPAKAAATKGYGAEVILYGHDSNQLFEKARVLAQERGATMVTPLFDRDMVAGLGTMGLELITEMPDLTKMIFPLGSGGHIAGAAAAVKQIKPEVELYGVQPESAAAMVAALEAGQVVPLDSAETMADGLKIKEAHPEAFRLVRELVEGVVTVPEEAMEEAIWLLMDRAKLVVEPSGAIPLAGLLSGQIPVTPQDKVALVLTGGNILLTLLAKIVNAKLNPNIS